MGIRTKVWRPGVDPDSDFTLAGDIAIDGGGKRFILDDPIIAIDPTTDFDPVMTTGISSVFPGVTCGKPGATPHKVTNIGQSGKGTYSLIATTLYTNSGSFLPIINFNLGGDGLAFDQVGVFSMGHNFSSGVLFRHWNSTLFSDESNLLAGIGTGVPLDIFIAQKRADLFNFDRSLQAGGPSGLPTFYNANLLGGLPPTGDPSIQVRNLQAVGDYELTNIRAYTPKTGIVSLNNLFKLPANFRSMKRLYIDTDEDAGGGFDPNLLASIGSVDYTKNVLQFPLATGSLQGFATALGGTLRVEGTEYVGRIIGEDRTGDPVKIYLLEPLPGSGTDLVGHFATMALSALAPCVGKVDQFGFFYPLRVDRDLEQTLTDYGNLTERPDTGLMDQDPNFPITFAPGDNFVWKFTLHNGDFSTHTVPYSRRYGVREVALEFDTTESAACATALVGA